MEITLSLTDPDTFTEITAKALVEVAGRSISVSLQEFESTNGLDDELLTIQAFHEVARIVRELPPDDPTSS